MFKDFNRAPVKRDGIKLSSLELFIDICGGRSAFLNFDILKVCDEFVKPLTFCTQSSYCDYLNNQESSETGDAQVFVSHSWRYKFLDLVDTLTRHFSDKPDIIVWLDLFSNNQHIGFSIADLDVIERVDHVVLMTSPWKGSSLLTKITCSGDWHAYAFDITMSPADQEEFQHAVDYGCNYALVLAKLVTKKLIESKFHKETNSNISFDGSNSEELYSLVLGLGDGFEVCGAVLRHQNISVDSFGDDTKEDNVVAKLGDLGIRNAFHQRAIARNMSIWRSHVNASDVPVDTLPAFAALQLAAPCGGVNGIKLSALDIFINECGGRSMLEGLSTAEVNNLYQKPLTYHMKSSYFEYLKTRDNDSVGQAQVFISHAWKYIFLDVVDALRYHFCDKSDVIIWFDVFVKNQHSAQDFDSEWWRTSFKSVIKQLNHTVLILSPWDNPIALTRAWCLFEIYSTADSKCKFEIGMGISDETNFVEKMHQDPTGYIDTLFGTIDMSKSEASNPADKRSIFEEVERVGGFHEVDILVHDCLRDWIIDTARNDLRDSCNEEYEAVAKRTLGSLLAYFCQYAEAEPYMRESAKYFEKCEDKDRELVTSWNMLAMLLKETERIDEALSLFEECLKTTKRMPGATLDDILLLKNNMAAAYEDKNEYADALRLYKNCDEHCQMLNETDARKYMYKNNIGYLYTNMGRLNEAFDLFTKYLPLMEIALKEEHPVTLQCMSNLAVVLHLKGNYEEALHLHTKCYNIRKVTLGEKNEGTIESLIYLAVLYDEMESYDEAQRCYEQSIALSTSKKYILAEYLSKLHVKKKLHFALNQFTEAISTANQVLSVNDPLMIAARNDLELLQDKCNRLQTTLSIESTLRPKGKLEKNLSVAKVGVTAEIGKALRLYCNDERCLSAIYWPKAFRLLCINLIKSLIQCNNWDESICSFDDLNQLISVLSISSSSQIKVKHRQMIVHLLREISSRPNDFGLKSQFRELSSCSSDEGLKGEWPTDLEDKSDLQCSIIDMSLRADVRRYLMNLLNEITKGTYYYSIKYFGAMQCQEKCLPIMIEVAEDCYSEVKNSIDAVSRELRNLCDGLLPIDLVQIKKVSRRNPIRLKEEGFHTSGSAWRTLGGILKYKKKIMGVTSGHVEKGQLNFITKVVDVAFLTLREEETDNDGNIFDNDNPFNLLPMQFIDGDKDDIHLSPGESVYKMGRSTGLTIGTLVSIDASFLCETINRTIACESHVEVSWNDVNTMFATFGDSGSIYCVKRGPIFVPIGIHRASDRQLPISYGCLFWKAMQYFQYDDSDDFFSFVNPPAHVMTSQGLRFDLRI